MAGTERLAILGGGVAGVVLANELSTRSHFEIDIIEKETRLGGLQRSVEIDGAVYDIGSFVFDPEHELLRTFPFLYDTFVQVPHLSLAITPHGAIDRYPATLRGYLRDNGAANFLHASLDLLLAKIIHRKRDTLISFMRYYLGNSMYVRSHHGDWKRIDLFSNYYGLHRGEHCLAVECAVRYANEGSIERQERFDYLTSHAAAATSNMVVRGIIETNNVRMSEWYSGGSPC